MLYRLLFFLLAVVATFLVREHFFFWDTVQLGSKHAHYFFETNFQSILLPEQVDSGHVPAFGMYLALCWKWFGKTLTVSHFSMLPFLLGTIYFLQKMGEELGPKKYAPWLVVLCFADPVLAGQSVLVSPDVALVCFFLMALWSIWTKKRKWLLVLAIIGLGLTSMRGMSLGVGLFFFAWLGSRRSPKLDSFFKNLWPFIPGGLIALAFLFYHYQETGWIGYHENSTWAPSFERVGWKGFLKNLAVLTWRLADFGRLFLWLVFLVAGFFYWQVKERFRVTRNSPLWRELVLVLIVFIAIVLNQLPYKGLLAHRYLLPLFLSLHFVAYVLLFHKRLTSPSFDKWRKPLFGLLLLALLTGNFWVYPKKISQGWDSTLAHLPWYELENKAEWFFEREKIKPSEVGTAFPNIGPREVIELNGKTEGFKAKNLDDDCWVLYSNIMNDFSDEEIDQLEEEWTPVFHEEKRGVCVIVYQNKKRLECGN